MTKRITYLDNAATTPVRPEVLEAMLPYLGSEAFGNPSSAHRFGRAARAGIEEAKRAVVDAVGAEPNQVVFTSGGTEADNLAIVGAALASKTQGGPFRVAVSATEHKAGLAAAHAVQHLGGEEIILPVTASGLLDNEALEKALARGVNCTPLTISGHKIGAPKGIGALIVRDRKAVEAIIHGGGQQFGIRPGTENVPGIIALGTAVQLAMAEQAELARRLRALRDELERRLVEVVPDAVIHGGRAERAPHVTNVSFPGTDSEALLMHLD